MPPGWPRQLVGVHHHLCPLRPAVASAPYNSKQRDTATTNNLRKDIATSSVQQWGTTTRVQRWNTTTNLWLAATTCTTSTVLRGYTLLFITNFCYFLLIVRFLYISFSVIGFISSICAHHCCCVSREVNVCFNGFIFARIVATVLVYYGF